MSNCIILLVYGSSDKCWCEIFENFVFVIFVVVLDLWIVYMEFVDFLIDDVVVEGVCFGVYWFIIVFLFFVVG